LIGKQMADSATLGRIESEVRAEMQSAVDFAVSAPYPSPDEVDQDVYA
jgi:TPP-dependent pyruvate/acetoin dehydrogenase alpha subunit